MAHKITNGMISFSGATPWHGLGTRVTPGTSPEAMLQAANLDWSVQLRSLAVSCTVEGNKNAWCPSPVARFKAVTRTDNNQVFAIPTSKYNPVQNIEIARFFADFADAASCELQVLGALEGGKKIWALAKVNADYQISAGDEQLGYVMLATSHDGSLRTVAMGTSVYVVCWNTMSAALSRVSSSKFRVGKTDKAKALFSLKHTGKFDNEAKKEAARVVSLVKEQQEQTAEMAELFSKIRMDGAGRIEFIRRLLDGESYLEQLVIEASKPEGSLLDEIVSDHLTKRKKVPAEETRVGQAIIDSILSSPGSDLEGRNGTLWGAINGVTYFVDHKRGRTQDSTLSGAWFGQGATLKAQAVSVAYDMSGIGGRA